MLVATEVAPLLQHLPWLTRVWSFPRTRGKARIKDSWPVFRALRREHFVRPQDRWQDLAKVLRFVERDDVKADGFRHGESYWLRRSLHICR